MDFTRILCIKYSTPALQGHSEERRDIFLIMAGNFWQKAALPNT